MKKIFTLIMIVALTTASVFAGGEQEAPSFPEPVPEDNTYGPVPGNRGEIGGPVWEEDQGVLVAGVLEDGPASAAGLRRGDIILAIDEREVNNLYDVRRVLSEYRGGDTVSLSVKRGDEDIAVALKLDDRLYHPPIGIAIAPGKGPGMGHGGRFDGKDVPFPDIAGSGALVAAVDGDGPAADAGITRGDIITAVNGITLGDKNLESLIRELEPGDTVSLSILRIDRDRYTKEIVIEATLGTGEDGGPYLGIQFIRFPGTFGPRPFLQGPTEGIKRDPGSDHVL